MRFTDQVQPEHAAIINLSLVSMRREIAMEEAPLSMRFCPMVLTAPSHKRNLKAHHRGSVSCADAVELTNGQAHSYGTKTEESSTETL